MNSKSDSELIAALSPRDVAGYLRARSWRRSGNFGEYGRILSQELDGEIFQVILPTATTNRDYVRRMWELIDEVARLEQRSSHDVLSDLSLAPFDVVRFRSPQSDQYGSIRIANGVALHDEARNVMLWSANAAASPKPRRSWKGRRFEEVSGYMDNVRLGQSQRGSFILTLLSPYQYEPSDTISLDVIETFGRRATKKLASALVATQAALRKVVASDDLKPFEEAVAEGVSSNLCQSLARLIEDSNGIDIALDWSASKPDADRIKVNLIRENGAVLIDAARYLAAQEPEVNVSVQGLVSQITEDPNRFDGSTVIEAEVGNSLRRIRVQFGPDERATVYDAALNKKWVQVVGDLMREGRQLRLLNPHDLAIVEPKDD
jgi:hypothetical protein